MRRIGHGASLGDSAPGRVLRPRAFAFRVCAVASLFALVAHAEGSSLMEAARHALSEGFPQVAARKLQTALAASDLDPADRTEVLLLLAEAQRAGRNRKEALETLDQLGPVASGAASLLRGDILASDARWEEALAAYREAGTSGGTAARLGEAECLQALGRTREAISVLEPLVLAGGASVPMQLQLASYFIEAREATKAKAQLAALVATSPLDQLWHRYLRARLRLLEGNFATALGEFEKILTGTELLSENLLAGATLGVAECRIVLNGWEGADKPLETFLWRYPENAWIELVFRRLDQIYARQRRPEESELQKWADPRKPATRRAALAQFYVARLQVRGGKTEKAMASLDGFIRRFREHPLIPQAHILRADLFLARNQLGEAVEALEAAERLVTDDSFRAEIELRQGLVQFQQQEFLLAAASFTRAAAKSPRLRDIATFDAALAWLNQQNDEQFFKEYITLGERLPDSELRGALLFEHGLVQARRQDARAPETLTGVLREFSTHPRAAEARLALGELALERADLPAAARFLKVASAGAKSSLPEDQAAYFALFLADAQAQVSGAPLARQGTGVIRLATEFLRNHPKSPLVPDVRMKLGQVYFRQPDFPNAETQFVTLARGAPESAHAEAALYLAGQCAMQMMDEKAVGRALDYFDEVAKRGGALKLYARQQQAIIHNGLGKESEAVALYDVILASDPPPEPELRFAALCGKGDNLLALGRKQPAQIEAALTLFDELARKDDVPLAWRNEALYKKARALEQLNRMPSALEAYYDLLDQTSRAHAARDGVSQREYLWFYKGGFDAARIFEQKSDWRGAIAVYEKMARLEGPRAAEARARTKQLRLEHFIWE